MRAVVGHHDPDRATAARTRHRVPVRVVAGQHRGLLPHEVRGGEFGVAAEEIGHHLARGASRTRPRCRSAATGA
ncbi:MAG TPA: hypothetical protein VJX66_03070 [Amycolatopsis sp.]|nr:hypothetical protein [Amycolatopsis sp.]